MRSSNARANSLLKRKNMRVLELLSGTFGPLSSGEVLCDELEAGDAFEVSGVMGHQGNPLGAGGGRDPGVIHSDGLSVTKGPDLAPVAADVRVGMEHLVGGESFFQAPSRISARVMNEMPRRNPSRCGR